MNNSVGFLNQETEKSVEKNDTCGNQSNTLDIDTSDDSLTDSFPIEMDVFRSTCHILLVFTGVPLNLFITIVILTFKRLHNKPHNVLWLGVIIFNLLTLLTILVELIAFHTQNKTVCLFFVLITGVAYTNILFNLLLALIDRYSAIVYPIWHRQKVTVRWVLIGQVTGFLVIVFVIKFPFIAHLAPLNCGFHPLHAKLIAVSNLVLFLSCLVAQIIVYFKTRQYFNSSRQRIDEREATVTFVQSRQNREAVANGTSPSQSRRPSAEAVVINNAGELNQVDSSLTATTSGQMMLRRHHGVGGNRRMEREATWSILSGVSSLLLFTFPTLLVAFIAWGCTTIYGEGFCPTVFAVITFYTRELLLGHLVYNPVLYMIRNREFSATVREKILFHLR